MEQSGIACKQEVGHKSLDARNLNDHNMDIILTLMAVRYVNLQSCSLDCETPPRPCVG